MRRLLPTVVAGISTLLAGVSAAFLLVSAVSTATLRFGQCGASSLDHAEPYCRVGEKLLLLSYASGAASVVLGILTLWLYTRLRRGPDSSFKPTSLRDAT
jgi:uncharacterized PurR-regulated membrane protein YhhQ (DUF165 family)